jgi:RHS repeat-associated protein
MAFHGLSWGAAERLLSSDYGSVVAGVSANAAGAVARSGRVVRYLGAYAAVVRGAHGLRIERSTTPLEVGDGAEKRPVDLTLHAAGSAFVPATPLADVSIARNSAGGVAVGSSGLRVTLEGAPVMGTQATGQSVFFGSVGPDTDASVAPTIDGAELFAVLRSRLSPDELRYRVALPTGATLEEHAGGAVVSRVGEVLARVAAPDARDAQGSVVPVSMRVSGDELLLSISDRDREVAYPVLVDPTVAVPISGSKGWTYSATGGIAWVHGSSLSLGAEATFPLAGEVTSGEASFTMAVPKTFAYSKVEFLGVGGFIRALPTEGWNGLGFWYIYACEKGESYGASGEHTWPSTITFLSSKCTERPSFYISLQLAGAGSHKVTVADEISVASILITYEASALEEEELGAGLFGEGSGGAPPYKPCLEGYPVNCATGNQVETQSDLSVGGRGPGLHLTRTYNSQAASEQGRQGVHGPFGYGWAATDTAHLTFPAACFRAPLCEQQGVDVHEDNGSALYFEGNAGGPYTAVNPLVQATLVKEGSKFVYTLPSQTKLTFNEAGELTSRTDRNGNAVTLAYNAEKQLESATDGAGRKLTFKYNGSGEVESVTDPMGHTVKYEYEAGNLVGVTQPGEAGKRWKFKYNAEHELTSETDGREHTVTTEYNEAHQAISQTDALSRKRSWKYVTIEGGTETTITEPNGSETVEKFNPMGLPTSVTRASGTAIAAATTYAYNGSDELTAVTDPNKHTTEFGYNAAGDLTSEKNADGDEKKWTYDKAHDVETFTTPDGETTTIKRTEHGNPESISRPAPGAKTQTTKYKYDADGDVESIVDPLGHEWKYEYDSFGDRKAAIDPEGNKRTFVYDEDSQLTSSVSPRGNATGGEPAAFTTSVERDAQGRALKVTEPEAGPRKPVDRTPAAISGVVREGQTLAASEGAWEGSPAPSYSYQWQRCNATGGSCANVSGVTSASYLVTSADVGDTLRVVATATNTGGSASSTSGATAVVTVGEVFASAFGSGDFSESDGVAVDPHGDVWVTDQWAGGTPSLEKFTPAGERVATYGEAGEGKGKFEEPTGLAINQSTGNVYVADGDLDTVQQLNEKGEYGKTIGSKGTGAGQLDEPVAVALDSSGNIWVADFQGQRVAEFKENGTFVEAFGWGVLNGEEKLQVCTATCQIGKVGSGNGQFSDPSGIVISGGHVYVSDLNNGRIEEFSTAGEYIAKFGTTGSGAGELSLAHGIGVDASGNLYVADSGNNRVEEFTPAGVYIGTFGSEGTGSGRFKGPGDVALNGSGELFVSDGANNRVQRWTPAAIPAAVFGAGDFAHPDGEALDPHGDLWVTDQWSGGTPSLEKFAASGERLASYGEHGEGKGKFEEPTGIAINQSTGNVYVSDGDLDTVQQLNEKGEYGKTIGSKGTGAGDLDEPVALTLDSSGNIWVADYQAQRIAEFKENGTFVKAFGWGVLNGEEKLQVCTTTCQAGKLGSGNGEFSDPSGIAISGGKLYVSDQNNDRIEEFTTAGEYVAKFGTSGSGAGQLSYPHDIGVAANGNLYVADASNDRITAFTSSGTPVETFGSEGSGAGQFSSPDDVLFNASGELLISDGENNRIQQWQLAGKPADTSLPSISGELTDGQTLAASTGTWTASPTPAYTYQWQRCNSAGAECANISGATSSTHTLVAADVGQRLRVNVTATNTGGNATATSTTSEVVGGPRVTEYKYDGDGNLTSVTAPNGYTTTYTYDADNEPTKVEDPNGTSTETEYSAMGQVTAQINGDKQTTKYERNTLGEITEVIEPGSRKTLKEYDTAGNVKKLTDPAKRTTTYSYDAANNPTEVSYSTGKPATIKYEYNKDGYVTKMTDGTGTTTYKYDELDRLTEAENGHKEVSKYEYNLANEPTKITYPNGKAITRSYDKDARLEAVTDWLEHTTKFSYDEDSNLKATIFPTSTSDEDRYTYNDTDEMIEAKFTKGAETLASLAYTRTPEGLLTKTLNKSLPGEENTESAYDNNDRLTEAASTSYEYDAANNPTKLGTGTYKYSENDELETGPSFKYTYDELGERTKTTPEKGPATTYGYDQASNLTSVERPKEGETTEIKDAYTYNGENLRSSQTVSGTTSYLDWDTTEELPKILTDGTNSYIYGPNDLPIEQISSGGTVSYMHHDQQGSTRLLTGSAGTVTGKCTYSSYGAPTCEGSITTPLGYDGQYTSADTGLIYMRARVYDPTTGQFLTVDPAVSVTRAPYNYAGDDPVNETDRTGLEEETLYCSPLGCVYSPGGGTGGPASGVEEIITKNWHEFEGGAGVIAEKAAEVWNEISGNGNGEERNPAQDKKMTPQEIEEFIKAGNPHPHELKPGGASEDLYRDGGGNIYVKPKGGAGPGEPTGIKWKPGWPGGC